MKIGFAYIACFILLTACGEPDVVVVEPIEEEGVGQEVISGDGIDARESVDEVIVCDPDDAD
ncbi:hypothetical protein A9995_13965 [Erythrobacter sp. QSSC1-22B]|uniref:hypothetical protein n=1 Tax=Erythrobacter sp. QSSC1-22B TaxID=1860125 RepID=UPI000805F303|nr:hypothetical protein [Erythrobacter sp. QSSC1-22B]OBX18039.1 hypothetical protein A9995_13965 [Erythrobacter sp. QSSC1-22B]